MKMKTVFWNSTLLTLCTCSLALAWPSFLWSQRHLPSVHRLSKQRSMTQPSKDVNKHENHHKKDESYIERAPEKYIMSKLDDEFIKKAPLNLYKLRDLRMRDAVHSHDQPISFPRPGGVQRPGGAPHNVHGPDGPIRYTLGRSLHKVSHLGGRDTDSLFYKTPKLGEAIYWKDHHESDNGRTKQKKNEVCHSDGKVKLIPCDSNPSRCIREDQVCNKLKDCDGGEDEDHNSCLLKKWVRKLMPKLEEIIQRKKDL